MVLSYTSPADQPYKDTVVALAGAFSAPLFIPGFVDEVSIVAIPGPAGSALVQYTVDPEEDVNANPTTADWVDWTAGTVTVKSGFAAKGAMTAVRIQANATDAVLKVAGIIRPRLR